VSAADFFERFADLRLSNSGLLYRRPEAAGLSGSLVSWPRRGDDRDRLMEGSIAHFFFSAENTSGGAFL